MTNGKSYGFILLDRQLEFIHVPYHIADIIINNFSRRKKVSCRLSPNPYGFGYILTMNYKGTCVSVFLHQSISRGYLKELLNKIYKHLLKSNPPSNG